MVVELIANASEMFPDVHLEEVDITTRPEVAVKYGVMSTPALAINGKLAFTGVPRAEALAARLQAAAGAGEWHAS